MGTEMESKISIRDDYSSQGQPGIDGGYAWVVLTASFFVNIITFGVAYCTGVFYVIFLEHLSYEYEWMVALSLSINPGVFFVIGPVIAIFINKYGLRKVGMIGGLVSGVSMILTPLSPNIYYVTLLFGVLTGSGFGAVYLVGVTAATERFAKYRSMALGVCMTGIGVGVLVYPMVIRALYEEYGWQWAITILGAFTLNLVACSATFSRPTVTDKHLWKAGSEKEIEENKSLLNLHIFKNLNYLLFCCASLLNCFGMSVMQVHLAQYSVTKGYTENESSFLFVIMGIASTLGQIMWSVLQQTTGASPRIVYTVGYCLAGLICIVLPFYDSLFWLQGCIALHALLCPVVMIPVVIVDLLGPNMMASGYGNLLLFEAIGQTLGGPIAGVAYQLTQWYGSSMLVGGGAMMFATLHMLRPCVCVCMKANQTVTEPSLDHKEKGKSPGDSNLYKSNHSFYGSNLSIGNVYGSGLITLQASKLVEDQLITHASKLSLAQTGLEDDNDLGYRSLHSVEHS